MPTLIEQLGAAIVQAREASGFKQQGLLDAMDQAESPVSGGTLSRWENGGNQGGPPFDKLVALAEVCGCTLHVELRQGAGKHRAVYRDDVDGRLSNFLASVAEQVGSLDDAGLRRVMQAVDLTVRVIREEQAASKGHHAA